MEKPFLNSEEKAFFKTLNSPEKIQDYLDSFNYNYCQDCYVCNSARNIIHLKGENRKLQCLDSAIFAAAVQKINNKKAHLMELVAPGDDYHFISPFKHNGLWGAIAFSRTYTLKWRDPIYKTPRELAMSYFLGFVTAGKLNLRNYTNPIEMDNFMDLNWIFEDKAAELVGDRCDLFAHHDFFSKNIILRDVPMELEDVYNRFKA